MDVTVKYFALMFGMVVLTSGCAKTSDPSANVPQQATEVANVQSAEQTNTQGTIKVDGSSTVYPITDAIAKKFQEQRNTSGKIEVNFSGTTAGFEKFCNGDTDISNASRPILKEEIANCSRNEIRFMEFPIAYDALTLVVHPENTWAKDITVEELKKMWEPGAEGKITTWKQVRASWPDKPLKLYGPGGKSGTFDYFTEAVVGKAKASRKDYTASEDDNTLVEGVSKDQNALGYFGYAYYQENQSKLKAVPVNSGKGAILPSAESVEKNQYQPLSRPLFIYVNLSSIQDKSLLSTFVSYYIQNAATTAKSVGYVPLPEDSRNLNFVNFHQGKVGTVFDGEAQINLTLAELLRKEGKF
jgi:phosphate transport system substrate-binding protein